ncbi:MAG: PKD domain-containing protein, partial [Solirubrobacterales bacterium]
GFEDGDECRNTPFEEDYGAPLGGSAGSLFNESINGGHYYLQQEWSNDIEDCAQRVAPAKPAIANPGTIVPGQLVEFSGAGSVPGDGGIVSYKWEFGDGAKGSGVHPSHTYAAVGNYTVSLTVTDDGGFTYSTSRQVEVTPAEEVEEEGGKEEGGGEEEKTGPTPSPTPAPTPAPSPTPRPVAPGVAVAAAKAKVKNGVALLKLTCTGGGACSGVVKLLDRGLIGHTRFGIGAGKSVTLHIKLTGSGIALLAGSKGPLKVSLSGAGVRHRSVALTPAA